jgi:hypothetical protein
MYQSKLSFSGFPIYYVGNPLNQSDLWNVFCCCCRLYRDFLVGKGILSPGQQVIFDYRNGPPILIEYGCQQAIELPSYVHPFGEGTEITKRDVHVSFCLRF